MDSHPVASQPMPARPWHAGYPAGVTPDAQPVAHTNLGQMIRAAAERYGDRAAETIVLPNGLESSLSFREVDELSDAFAAYLRGALGLAKGERVAILLPNSLAYSICAFGVLKAGAVVVNTNPLYTPRELELQLKDSGAKVLVILDKFGEKLASVLPKTSVKTVVVTSIADFFPFFLRVLIGTKLRLSGQIPKITVPYTSLVNALRHGAVYQAKARLMSEKPEEPAAGDLALLQYTGGTTGKSKGAMLTHANLLANVGQITQITGGYFRHGGETVLTVLPLYHVFAFTINLLFSYSSGTHSVLVPNPRPLKNLRPAFRAHDITWTTAVNTLLKALLAERWFQQSPPPHLREVYSGGSATQPAVLEAWEKLTGSMVIEGYGMSETSPLITFNPARPSNGKVLRNIEQVGGAGLPLPGTDLRIVGDDGTVLGPGEKGEIAVRGPQVMRGYWQQQEETDRVLKDGWLRTGDVGCLDAGGYLEITDRKKDMIIVSGFKVFPNEVEACIAMHPEVADVAVVGIPDEGTGEAVRAFIVPRTEGLTADEIVKHCRELLVNYKIPRSVSFIGEMPKNAVGKTLRRELRAGRAEGS